ncbi:MAG: phosphodiester glycosidase family protein [Clostridia bacterium]|nr:phosphodiester glycosidase family protein [Clostridia bacterium]
MQERPNDVQTPEKKKTSTAKKSSAAATSVKKPNVKKPAGKKSDGKKTAGTKKKTGHKTSGKKSARLRAEQKAKKLRSRKRWRLVGRIVGRVALFAFVLVVAVVVGLYLVLDVFFHGPSQTAGDNMAMSLFETSAAKFVPSLYYSDEEIAELKERNKTVEIKEETDTNLIVIAPPVTEEEAVQQENDGFVDGIKVEEIKGATYHGWMMTVLDPSRVMLGVSADWFDDNVGGLRIEKLAEKYNAVAAINGGSFNDGGGQGNGGMPNGVTVTQGKVCNSHGGADLITVGFDQNNVLIVGKMTKKQAEERGIRDACSFGPALVVNGVGAETKGTSSGLNPRTAIGQRADGAVLMLVIDGRQVNSLGANIADLVEIMLSYGAVNACNLDGGSSSNIYYNGEMLNDGVAITGARRIPTAFVVR